jgi:hypothetical protein
MKQKALTKNDRCIDDGDDDYDDYDDDESLDGLYHL